MHRFIHGDAISEMARLRRASVDLVVTSPPYNADKEYASYSDDLSLDAYEEFADRWVGCIPRLLKPHGALWLNVGYTKLSDTETLPLSYLYYPLAVRHGLRLIQEVVWHYEGGLPYKRRFAHRTERWMWFVKDPANFTFNLDDVRDPALNRRFDKRNNPLGKNPTDLWYFNRVNNECAEKTGHPCQFPEAMIERIIRASSNEGETVLDCFGGSGTTALVAHRTGRKAISIEIDEGYHQIAQERCQSVA
jgi:adenine-specific DNA-methyltransferase